MGRLPSRGRPWAPEDRTGGPIDDVLDLVRRRIPGLIVERLDVVWPGDDDNLYFLGDDFGLDRVQIETAAGGAAPFTIEDGGVIRTSDVAEAAAIIVSWLDEAL
jgi:hypothetical protein